MFNFLFNFFQNNSNKDETTKIAHSDRVSIISSHLNFVYT